MPYLLSTTPCIVSTVHALSRASGAAAAALALVLVSLTPALANDAPRAEACSAAARAAGWVPPRVHTADARLDFEAFVARLAALRVVYLGEYHDRYGHHLNQLEVICRLHAAGRPLAIGLESFQQPFQSVLDRYVAGEIDERTLLRESEYFTRWGFDYRLYAPILRFAATNGVELVALNLPAELTRKVGRGGIGGLTPDERAQVPTDIDRSSERYRMRIRKSFQLHPPEARRNFEYFFDAQLMWDEGMAERGAAWVSANPGATLVVIAGEGHVIHGDGIPMRLARRADVPAATVLQSVSRLPEADAADYRLETQPHELAPPGRLGVLVEPAEGGVGIRELTEGSAAGDAGAREGDRIVAIDGQPVAALADVRIALYDKAPGARVRVELARGAGDDTEKLRVRLR